MQRRCWGELTSGDFALLDRDRTVAIFPFAAVEQHGPHLPLITDTVIAEGLLRLAAARCADDLPMLILPVQAVGASSEHLAFPGTLSLAPQVALAAWIDIAAGVERAGFRRLVLINAHGGNSELLGLLAREMRIRHRMLCVVTGWRRFGLPPDLFPAEEAAFGIHGGDIETSLMLHLRPDLVRMDKAEVFRSTAIDAANEFACLRATGAHAYAWAAQDLNPAGVVGNAKAATAEKGRLTAEHQVAGFLTLLHDVANFPLARIA